MMIGWHKSLMHRLVAYYLLLSVLTVAVLAVVASISAREALQRSTFERLGAVAATQEAELTRWVADRRAAVELLASLPDVRELAAPLMAGERGSSIGGAEHARLAAFLQQIAGHQSDLQEIFVLSDVGGRIVASTTRANEGEYRVTDRYFTQGRTRTFVQNVYPSPLTGRPTLTISTPLRDAAGRAIGVLAAHVSLAQMDRILTQPVGLGESGESYLVDRYKEFVSGERFGRDRYTRGVHSPGVDAVLQQKDGSGAYLNYAGVPVIGVYRWINGLQLGLMVEMHQREAFSPARRLAWAIVVVGLASAVVLAGGVYLIARRIAQPIIALTRAATRVAEGDLMPTAAVVTDDEVGVLARVFNEMTEQLRYLYANLEEKVVESSAAASEAAESKRLLQAIIDSSPAVIWVKSADGRYVLVNGALESLAGVERDSAVGQTDYDIFPREVAEAMAQRDREVLEQGVHIEVEEHFPGNRTLLVARFPLFSDDGAPNAVCGVATDITERKLAEEERRRLESRMLEAQKMESLGVLAGGIAHDFNNLLVSVLGNAELAQMDLPEDSPVHESLEQITVAARRAADLTNQMLAYSGRGKFVVSAVELNAVIREMTQLLEVSIPKKVKFEMMLAANLPPVDGDATQLRQVVMNLVTNAAEAIGTASGTVTVRTGVVTTPPGGLTESYLDPAAIGQSLVYVEVSDTGAGMDPEVVQRIFEPFFTTKFTGRGLGLAALQGVVRGHHGALQVQSERGRGTTFRIFLPAGAGAAEGPPSPAVAGNGWRGEGTVLVVDDEETVRRFATRALNRYGFQVITAADGVEAVEVFRERSRDIDVVVLDLTMPRMSGEETLRELLAIRPDVQVVLSSGYTEQDAVARFSADGIAAFLQKPYAPEELLAKLRDLIS
jgi:PAS domain S-box-containing protein